MRIYQARFNRLPRARPQGHFGLAGVGFLGDGEMDEPEAVGALSLAGREGPTIWSSWSTATCSVSTVRCGNGKIIQGAGGDLHRGGLNVIKVPWSRDWDPRLLAQDYEGVLVDAMNETVDGEWQRYW